MFCSHCGAKAEGNFCSACGRRLAANQAESDPPPPQGNWQDEIDPKALLERPEVRALIERAASESQKPIAAEEYFKFYDKLGLLPVSMGTFVSIVQPMFAKWGVGTGKTRTEEIAAPPGRVLASLFCSFARKGRKVLESERGQDGCVVTAELPSDFFSMAGKLIVGVQRTERGSRVEAATAIKGQYFDWGKSTRCLNDLFADLRQSVG